MRKLILVILVAVNSLLADNIMCEQLFDKADYQVEMIMLNYNNNLPYKENVNNFNKLTDLMIINCDNQELVDSVKLTKYLLNKALNSEN